jgi:hypothetical protein
MHLQSRVHRSILSVLLVCGAFFGATGGEASAASCSVPSVPHPTIASALADITCDPVNVAAGTYDEVVSVTRNVAIHGAGAATTKIAPTSLPSEIVAIRNGATAELDGFTIRYPQGYYVSGMASNQAIGVHVYEGATAHVHDNVITEIHNDVINGNQMGHCVMVGNNSPSTLGNINLHDNTITYCQKQGVTVRAGANNVTIADNEIAYGNQGDSKDPGDPNIYASNGIVLRDNNSATITGNDVHGWICTPGAGSGPPCGTNPLSESQSVGILPFGTLASLTVTGNNVHDNDLGVGDYFEQVGSFDGNQIGPNDNANVQLYGSKSTWTSNTITGSGYGLILTSSGSDVSDATLTGNTISGHSQFGIYADASPALGTLEAHRNSITGNGGGSAVANLTSAEVTCNWWGATSGPTAAANPGGSGDALSTGAVFSPWAYSGTTFECGPATPTAALSFADSPLEAGAATTLTLTLGNTDSDPISDTSGSFTMPAGLTLTGVVSNSCGGSAAVGGGTTGSFSGAQIPASGACVIVFNVTADATGVQTVTLPAGDVSAPRGATTVAASASVEVSAVVPPDPIPGCDRHRLIITDVAMRGSRVRVAGLARLAHVGSRVALSFRPSGSRVVGYASVRSDGTWSVYLRAPASRLLRSNNGRYRASLDGDSTPWIKVVRRMGTTSVTYAGGRLKVTGSVRKPLAPGARVAVNVSVNCGSYGTRGTLRVNSRGRFSGSVAVSERDMVVFARLRVRVRHSSHGRRTFSTYSIVQPVILRQ